MAALGGEVHSIDVVARNIAIARHHAGQSNLSVRYEALAAEQLVCRRDCYDVVLNMEVVEHVADLSSFLRACSQLVKGGGLMFIATINRTPLAWLTAILGAEYVLRWLPRGTHRWRRFPKPNELEGLLAEDGLRIIARQGVGVNPFKRRMFLTRFTSVNYMLVAQKAGQ
jgi:2-polyprenyl-6-hydroxyphenyl methylase/3-demethylubiquinone-9 3-methyltransferase